MNRFKDLCSSSDSDEQVERQPVRRGRQRENKRFTEADNTKIVQKSPQNKKQKTIQTQSKPSDAQKNISNELLTSITLNEYNQSSSVRANEKFIRQKIKPAQQQLDHYLQKIQQIMNERKKYINAINSSTRDIEKVGKKLIQLKSDQARQKYSSEAKRNLNSQSSYQFNQNKKFTTVSSKIQSIEKLQEKIRLHLSKLMTQHTKTIQLLTQAKMDMMRSFESIKFAFLDTEKLYLRNQQTEQYEEYSIQKSYRILEKADQIIKNFSAFEVSQ